MTIFGTVAKKAGDATSRHADKLAKGSDATRVATQNAAGLKSGNDERKKNGLQPLPATNVWTQSWSRLGDHVTGDDPIPMTTPIGALGSIMDQGTDAFSSTSMDSYSVAVGQQWDNITNDFSKIFTAPPEGTSTGMAALGTVGNIFSLFTSIEQMVTMWVGMIPFPAFPALRIFDIATAIPPRTGPILPVPFLSGANTVLINMMPAGRCGDMGISVGIAPPWVTVFEVFFGSCNVWIEGCRAGRLLVDFTDHMKAGWGPCITGSPNVLVGGFPLPSLLGMAMGAAFKKAFEKAGKLAKRLAGAADDAGKAADNVATKVDNLADNIDDAAKKADDVAPAAKASDDAATKSCKDGCPVKTITGECVDKFNDGFLAPQQDSEFQWTRYYNSSHHRNEAPVGNGFRHSLQCELFKRGRRWIYIDQQGDEHEFLIREPTTRRVYSHGYVMRRVDSQIVEVIKNGEATRQFHLPVGARAGRLMALVASSRKLSIQYDTFNRIGRCTIDSTTTRFKYDSGGRLIEVQQSSGDDDIGTIASYAYDDAGNLTAAIDHRGGKWRYTYHNDNRINAIVDPIGYGFYHTYDPWGRVTHTYGDDGLYDLTLEYFPTERKTVVRFADGVVKSYHYDNARRISYIIDGCDGVTTYARDGKGRVTAEISPAGELSEHLYDDTDALYAIKDPLGYLHDPDDPPNQRRNPLAYELPSQTSVWQWGKLWTEIVTDDINVDDAILDQWDATTRNAVARVFNRERATEGLGRCISERSTAPPATGLGLTEIPESVDRPSHEVETDAAGNLIAVRDADGRSQSFSRSRWRSRGSDTRGDGGVTRYEHNLREYVGKIVDPRGSVHQYSRDGLDRITEIRQDDEVLARYVYDACGKVNAKLNSSGGIVFHWERGAGGAGIRRHLANDFVEEFQNDAKGRITAANSPAADCAFTYGPDGLRPTSDLRDDVGVVHGKDELGNKTTTYLGSLAISYQTDGRSTRLTDPTGQTHEIVAGDAGLFSVRFANGLRWLSQYNASGSLAQTVVRGVDGDNWQRQYTYSSAGKLAQIADSQAGERVFAYDQNGRIKSATGGGLSETFHWDLADNLISSPHLRGVELSKCNRLDRAEGHQFAYDQQGRLVQHTSPDGTRQFEFDNLDRLVRCEIDGKQWKGEYDPLCRIIRSEFDGRSVENFWDDFRLAARRWDNGRIRLFIYADESALVPLMFVDYENEAADPSQGKCYYLLTDLSGMPIRAIDSAGQTAWSATRHAFGQLDVDPSSRISLDLRFPGHLYDAAIGVHHNRFRTYDPQLGRYLQTDPIGVVGGVNTYAYCPDPISNVDVDGHGCGDVADNAAATKNADDAVGANSSKAADEPKTGAQLAAEKNMPALPEGYHWTRVGDQPVARANPKSGNPPIDNIHGEWVPRTDDAYRRASFTPAERQAVYDSVPKGNDGKPACPCGKPVDSPNAGDMDMGHQPDHSFAESRRSAIESGQDPKDFAADQKNLDNYRPEHPSCNRSHKYE
ncbi:hypothetical protein CKO51_00135 [Rhodopirellula sp. SM50]|nr:RHS repeat-associated core domain-containing protein [Rhodopirellula sp. SM50]PAY21517.1 hypothetical protein CKO51_00135 [Rhodopirellula sp. SM50]